MFLNITLVVKVEFKCLPVYGSACLTPMCHIIDHIIVANSISALALMALFKMCLTPIDVWSEVKLC